MGISSNCESKPPRQRMKVLPKQHRYLLRRGGYETLDINMKLPVGRNSVQRKKMVKTTPAASKASIVYNSLMLVPYCSFTGLNQLCYKQGYGGWQSAYCTTTRSKLEYSAFQKQLVCPSLQSIDVTERIDILEKTWHIFAWYYKVAITVQRFARITPEIMLQFTNSYITLSINLHWMSLSDLAIPFLESLPLQIVLERSLL